MELDDDVISALKKLSVFLLQNPELAFKEYKAHDACIAFLRQHCPDWKITEKAYQVDTAWEAVYSQGKGGRRIVFCSEYDALPDVGHACILSIPYTPLLRSNRCLRILTGRWS